MLHHFHTPVADIPLPERFTFPFFAIYLIRSAWQQRKRCKPISVCRKRGKEELAQGKMFGVLVVRTQEGETGYLAAFSGILAGSNVHPFFVPPVYDLLQPQGFFKIEEEQISQINTRIGLLEEDEEYKRQVQQLAALRQTAQETLEEAKRQMKRAKEKREERRREAALPNSTQ